MRRDLPADGSDQKRKSRSRSRSPAPTLGAIDFRGLNAADLRAASYLSALKACKNPHPSIAESCSRFIHLIREAADDHQPEACIGFSAIVDVASITYGEYSRLKSWILTMTKVHNWQLVIEETDRFENRDTYAAVWRVSWGRWQPRIPAYEMPAEKLAILADLVRSVTELTEVTKAVAKAARAHTDDVIGPCEGPSCPPPKKEDEEIPATDTDSE